MSDDLNVVYGCFVWDPDNELNKIPVGNTNDDKTEKCVYVGKSTRGLKKRSGEHEAECFREYKKNGEHYDSFDYLKNRVLRQIKGLGLKYEWRKLCVLTGGEEFEWYVTYMRSNHPCSNEKACDQYTNFKEELEELYHEGKITNKDELQEQIRQLKHQHLLRTDHDYAVREHNRIVKQEKMLIKEYLNDHLPEDMFRKKVTLGRFIQLSLYGSNVIINVDKKGLAKLSGQLGVAAGVLYPLERRDIIVRAVVWWIKKEEFRCARLRTKTPKQLIIEEVSKHFDTAEEFAVSIGYLTDADIKGCGLYRGK